MAFRVKIFDGASDYEALHVAKLTRFPLEQRDYKPYSQARVCFSREGFCVQLLSFEAEPLPESAMKAVFVLQPGAEPLIFSINALGEFSIRLGKRPVEGAAHYFTGEDLQGVFWGGNLTISPVTLKALFPDFVPAPDVSFSGNLYKLCENPKRPHYGCYYAADFSKPLFASENLGDFVCIDY